MTTNECSMYLLHHLLIEQAGRTPDRMAVSLGQTSISYAELELRSNCLASTLTSQGVGKGDRVGIMLEKSIEAIVSVFGILKSGAVYVPLDSKAPHVRLTSIIQRCDIRCLICSSREILGLRQAVPELGVSLVVLVEHSRTGTDGLPADIKCIEWDEATAVGSSEYRPVLISDQSPAYILHTSGSTGVPKGVVISHLNSLTFVRMATKFFGINGSDRVASLASLAFDLSVFDIFGAMMGGATIVLVPEFLAAFPAKLSEFIDRERISIWNSVASVLNMMADRGRLDRFSFDSLRLVHFSGDIMPAKYLRILKSHMRRATFYNIYGQTEANSSLHFAISDVPEDEFWRIPIGVPFPNFEVFALNDQRRVINRPGEEGELHVCSATVALGYLRDEAATRQRFISDPRGASWRSCVYKTGDLVRLDEFGNFIFVGRLDTMVKSRGYRVELSETEVALNSHPNVSAAVALAIQDDVIGARIVAYASLVAGKPADEQDLKAHCAKVLPPYMVPEEIHIMSGLPRTATGKLDREAIRALHCDASRSEST